MDSKLMRAIKKNKITAFTLSRLHTFVKPLTPDVEQAVDQVIKARDGKGSRRRLRSDITYCRFMYGTKPEEYVLFRMYEYKDFARWQFFGHQDQKACELSENNPAQYDIFTDKYQCYQQFSKYYKRDVVCIRSEGDMERYRELAQKHDKLILKPFDGKKGMGVRIFDPVREPLQYDRSFESEPIVVEEVMVQVEPLRSLHPASINTVRALTVRKNDKTHVLYTIIRIGVGNSVVDNAGAGGISADIDLDTGIICTVGHRENGKTYVRHPDTGVIIPGMVIPRWRELMDMLEELSKVVPGINVIGWDMALTEKGWAVIEANNFPAMTAVQMCRNRGIRKELEAILQ